MSSSSGGASNTLVSDDRAASATPPNDWLVIATTRRPIHFSAPSPAVSTTPHTSMPSVNGTCPWTLATVPRQRAMSPKFRDAAETAMRTSPGPTSGTGMSWTSSASVGAPCRTTRTAFTARPPECVAGRGQGNGNKYPCLRQAVARCGHRGGRHLHQVPHERLVLQLGTPLAAAPAEQAGAVSHRPQDEGGDEREPLDADVVADVGHAGREERVHLVASRSGEHGLQLLAVLGRVFTRQLRDDQQAAPSPPPALRQLRRGTHDGFDHHGHVVIRGTRGDLEQLALTAREKRHVTVDDRAQHAVARPEVVVQRTPVSLSGLPRDLDERRIEYAILGECTSGGIQELLPRVRSIRWHALDVTF